MERKRTAGKADIEKDALADEGTKPAKLKYVESTIIVNVDSFLEAEKHCFSKMELHPAESNQVKNCELSEWPEKLPASIMQRIKSLEEQVQHMKKEREENQLRMNAMEKIIQEQNLKMEEELQNWKHKVEELESRCTAYENERQQLRNKHSIQDEKIRILENTQLEQKKFSCGPVFHSHVVYRGTDTVVPCECIKDYFSMLPDELILKIFRMLPRSVTMPYCAPVCQRWNRLCCDSSLWKAVNLDQKAVKISTVAKLVACGVEHLSLHGTKLDNQGQSFLSLLPFSATGNPAFSKLQYLDLSDIALEADTLQEILSVCSQLKYLSLYYIFKIPIRDAIWRHIAANKDLRELNLGSVLGFTSAGILDICSSCTKLEILNLTWTYLNEEAIDIISSNLPSSITTLLLNGNKEFQDSHIQRIIERCPNITKLNIPCCFRLTSAVIDFIVTGLQNIQHLDISYNKHILPEKLFMLKDSKSLKELVIDHFEEEEDAVFLSNLKNVLPDVRIFSN